MIIHYNGKQWILIALTPVDDWWFGGVVNPRIPLSWLDAVGLAGRFQTCCFSFPQVSHAMGTKDVETTHQVQLECVLLVSSCELLAVSWVAVGRCWTSWSVVDKLGIANRPSQQLAEYRFANQATKITLLKHPYLHRLGRTQLIFSWLPFWGNLWTSYYSATRYRFLLSEACPCAETMYIAWRWFRSRITYIFT